MPRKPRMYLPGIPAHVVQRGNNRDACFFADEDYRYYLNALAQGCQQYDVQLHAYCLITNHVHLLMTQQRSNIGVSQVMQHIGRMYVAYVNKTYRRSGTLWQGRHQLLEVDVHEIRQSLAYNYPVGDDRFQKQIERALGRRT